MDQHNVEEKSDFEPNSKVEGNKILNRLGKINFWILFAGLIISNLLVLWSFKVTAIGCLIILIISMIKIRHTMVTGIIMTVLSGFFSFVSFLGILGTAYSSRLYESKVLEQSTTTDILQDLESEQTQAFMETDEELTVDSDNWKFFFQDQKYERNIQFARRFVIAKAGGPVNSSFFENFGENNGYLAFVHKNEAYYIIETDDSLGVMREDLLVGKVSTDFSQSKQGVKIEVPSDTVVARTQAAVDLFAELEPDFNGKSVSAHIFRSKEDLDLPSATLNRSNYAIRDDGYSQIAYKLTGEDFEVSYMLLVLIYQDDELAGALLTPGNRITRPIGQRPKGDDTVFTMININDSVLYANDFLGRRFSVNKESGMIENMNITK